MQKNEPGNVMITQKMQKQNTKNNKTLKNNVPKEKFMIGIE